MMLQLITDAVISRGYDGTPALYVSEDGQFLSFRVGHRIYDTRAQNNTRWINFNVNVTGELIERVRKMNLKEGSHINVVGTFDMRPNVNRDTGEVTTWPTIKAMSIEFASGYKPRQEPAERPQPQAQEGKPATQSEELENFVGYVPFGSDNPYYPD